MSDTILGFNKSNLVLAAGVAGAAFLGYCIYFDHKRITAPDYKEKIRQKRRVEAGAGGKTDQPRPTAAGNETIPDVTDPTQMQRFFLQEVQLGEELMAAGNIEEGAVHIANSVMLCGQSQQLLSIFQHTLSEEQFNAVIQQMPLTRERLSNLFGARAEEAENESPLVQYLGDGPPPAQIQELIDDTDDLE